VTLSNERVIARGVSAHTHEREAVDFAIKTLPDREPYRLWALIDLVDNKSGRRYDLDLVVIGYHAIYLVEIKSYPGRITGDSVDWYVDFPDGGRASFENPLRLTTHKARVLGSMLDRAYGTGRPYVQPLVFLSAADANVQLAAGAREHVVTRSTIERAITFGEFPGAPARLSAQRIDRPTAQRTTDALRKLGLRESVANRKVGNLVLSDVILDRQSYQDHLAHNERLITERARVRTYQVAPGSGEERRQQIVRAAEREARTLSVLSDHPNILRLKTYVADGPNGVPCVVFEDFGDALPLDAFLRAYPALTLDDRVRLLELLADALAYCHRKQVLHRGLAPSAVLVRKHPETKKIELRLFNFQLSVASEVVSSGSLHLTTWFDAGEEVYVAPEVLEKPEKASEASDMFSLGAITYLVLTGRPPGENLVERVLLMSPGYLSLATAQDTFAAGVLPLELLPKRTASDVLDLEYVMRKATAKSNIDREVDLPTWIAVLVDALTAPAQVETPVYVDPLLARKGDEITRGVSVEAVLGTGSTARTLRIAIEEGSFALKVALSPDLDERVRREGQVLSELSSDRIVHLYDELEIGGRACLRMTDAGDTLAKLLEAEGVPSLEFARRWGEDLLLALSHLEERGVQHRDIKPGNLGVLSADVKKKRHLYLFDFSLSSIDPKDVRAGTPAYRDPFLPLRGRWDDAADRYAAAMTLYELLTGERPRWGDEDIASATEGPITIAAERFDASVRDRLARFFLRAFARTAEERFGSADDMRSEWAACFSTHRSILPAAASGTADGVLAPLPGDLSLDTLVRTLPLADVIKSALDRRGVLSVRDLLQLRADEYFMIRGIGRAGGRQIAALVERPELAQLRAALDGGARDSSPPTESQLTVWLEQFLPVPKKKHGDKPLAHVRVLFGLDAVSGVYIDSVAQVAARLRVTRALVYSALSACRERWDADPMLAELAQRVLGLAEAHSSVVPLDTLATALATELNGAGGDETQALHVSTLRQARALCRVVLETHDKVKLARLREVLWVVPDGFDIKALDRLGAIADELATADPLLSPGAVEERLRERAVADLGSEHLLAQLPSQRLLSVGALASKHAAKSARLELYPRGLSHVRALDLCVTALPAVNLKPELLRNAVRARYPEAEPLPEGADLLVLMQARGYRFDEASAMFERARAAQDTGTQAPYTRQGTVHTPHRTTPDPDAHQFAQDIDVRAKRGSFCVLEVPPARAVETARELCHRLGVKEVSLERELLTKMQEAARELEIPSDVVYGTDREGRSGSDWANLRKLLEQAGEQLLAVIKARPDPVVLTDPGLLARYGLTSFVKALIDHTRSDEAPATFMIVPVTEEPGGARIHHPDGDLPLPITSQAQRLRVPDAWIKNLDRR
jgi:serine/threonine protein kinase